MRGGDILHDAVELHLRDLRALESVLCERVTDDVLGRALLEALHELVVDGVLDVDAGAGTAALAVVEVDAEVDPLDGLIDVGVVEDNVGTLAAKLESNLLQVGASSRLHDLATDNGGTCKNVKSAFVSHPVRA